MSQLLSGLLFDKKRLSERTSIGMLYSLETPLIIGAGISFCRLPIKILLARGINYYFVLCITCSYFVLFIVRNSTIVKHSYVSQNN